MRLLQPTPGLVHRPERAAVREYLALILGWAVYYAIVLLIVMPFVLLGRVGFAATLTGFLAAAPLLIGGWRMLLRGRR